MAAYLKSLAAFVVLLGVLTGLGFVSRIAGDEAYQRARMMRERNAGNVLFESEYRVAEAGHVFLIYSAVSCFLTALIGGSLLWGLGSLHSKIDGAIAPPR
jgi:hypothetical protein